MWDLSSLTRIEPEPPAVEARSLNHWTAREVLSGHLKKKIYLLTYLLIHFRLRWVFVAVQGLSLVAASRGYYIVAVRGLLIVVASLVVELGL